MSESGQIESTKQFGPPSPTSKASRWQVELAAARKNQDGFWTSGDKANREYRGEKGEGGGARLNLFYADVRNQEASLSGTPRTRARRRYADALDDVARVSADILDRLLNTDVEQSEDEAAGFRAAADNARGDWLRTGLGVMRFRYVMETEPTPETPAKTDEAGNEIAPAVPAGERKRSEDVDTMYVNWRDLLWSPCRTWDEVRWVAFRAEMTKDEAKRQFGEDVAKRLPIKSKLQGDKEDKPEEAWSRIELWEIWNKDDRTVYHYCEGYDRILKETPDPLELPGFFPCQRPLVANSTTDKLMPRSSFYLAEDLYEEAHSLTRRIRALVKAIKVVGLYDAANPELARLLDEACDNELLPAAEFTAFLAKGGLASALQLLPIEAQVKAVAELVLQRNVVRQEISEVLGSSDVMRGQSAERVTATTDRIKARAFSMRAKVPQDEFARFIAAGQRIRAQIIARWFDPETIAVRSNMANTADAELMPQAIDLIKQDVSQYRIDVDAESLSMTDFDAVEQDGLALLKGSAEFFTAVAPIAVDPMLMKFFVGLYQQAIAGMRAAPRMEGIVDRFVAEVEQKAKQPPAPPPPDPKVEQEKIKTEAIKLKAQTDAQKSQMDMQGKVMDLQIKREELGMKRQEMAMDAQAKQQDMALNAQERMQDHAMKREEMELNRESMHEGHEMEMERAEMGMAAHKAKTDQQIRAAKAKPKPKGKED